MLGEESRSSRSQHSSQSGLPDFVREHTGQVIGGVSPLAHPAPVPTYLDEWLARHEVVWAAAGHPAAVYATTYAELREMTGAVEVPVEPVEPG